jgi:hypothetical protein
MGMFLNGVNWKQSSEIREESLGKYEGLGVVQAGQRGTWTLT